MATTQTLTGRTYVEAPSRTPRAGGLLAAAQVREYAQAELRGYAFYTDAKPTGGLYDYATGPGQVLTFSNGEVPLQEALKGFDVLESAELGLFAGDSYDPEGTAKARLAANESRLVEQAFLAKHLAGATVLNGGTAVKLPRAIALLEEYAAANYLGLPLFHAPLTVGIAATGDLLVAEGGNARVRATGTTVALGVGYAAALTGTEALIYATGQVVLARGAVDTFRGVHEETNRERAFAIRTYVPAIETFTVAVKADLS